MPIERRLWNPPFEKLPAWPCSRCGEGQLVEQKGSLKTEETGPSAASHNHPDWDPEWVIERFSGFLYCTVCGDIASISGTSSDAYYYEQEINGKIYSLPANTLHPKSICPAPHFFPIPSGCPETVREYLDSGFTLFWSDHESCANKFRMSVEAILNDKKVPKYSRANKGGKRKPLPLHSRIETFRKKHPEAAEYLEAVKWIGNHGSHSAIKLNIEHVLGAADILQAVLELLYPSSPSPLATAKKINKRRGPP